MASVLLPNATAAAAALNTALPIAVAATGAGSGYGGAIAPVLSVNLPAVTTNITAILTAITPAGPMGPPSLLTIPDCNKALTDVTTLATVTIPAATTSSVVLLGLPDPATFPVNALKVQTDIAKLITFVTKNFVTPQI